MTARRRAAALAVAAVALAGASPAEASEVAVGRSCYAEGGTITVRGTGFSPAGPVAVGILRGRTQLVESLDPLADPEGRVSGRLALARNTGWFRPRQTRFTAALYLRDLQLPGVFSVTVFTLSRWTVLLEGRRLRAVGWTHAVGRPLYAHHVVGGRRIRTVRLGVLRGACGDLRAPMPRMTGGRVVFGTSRSHRRGPTVSVPTSSGRRPSGR